MDPASDPAPYRRRALALAELAWLVELGADEAIGDVAVDRTALPAEAPGRGPRPASAAPRPAAPARPVPAGPPAAPAPLLPPDPRGPGAALAEAAADLAALAAAMEGLESDLRAAARSFVFADGTAGAPLMVVGEAPGREEDIQGRPFVGPAGQLLDRMLGAIGRDRTDPAPSRAVYVANLLPWRPPGNRAPTAAEVAQWAPFLRRHVALARPRVLLLAGNTPCQALLGRGGITRLRGGWQEVGGVPAMPTFHPSYLLRIPDTEAEAKRAARQAVWDDLRAVAARLADGGA